MYSNLEILTIFKNCHTITELSHALAIFLYLIGKGEMKEDQKGFIYQRMKIRKRQF